MKQGRPQAVVIPTKPSFMVECLGRDTERSAKPILEVHDSPERHEQQDLKNHGGSTAEATSEGPFEGILEVKLKEVQGISEPNRWSES